MQNQRSDPSEAKGGFLQGEAVAEQNQRSDPSEAKGGFLQGEAVAE